MKTTSVSLGRRLAIAAVACGVVVGLTGCLQSNTSLPGAHSSATTSASAKPTASATPTPSPTPTDKTVVEDCNILLTPAQVYAYNPNYVRDPGYAPKAGSLAAAIAAARGQTCGWLDETSGSVLEVALAIPTSAQFAAAQSAASTGTPLDEAGYHGFFAVKAGVGSAQFFIGSFWLDVSSPDFATADDASAVYPTVVENQVHAGG